MGAIKIRGIVASRLHGDDVLSMHHAPDWTVRLAAVENAPLHALRQLDEQDPEVRGEIEERLGLGGS